jgi:hypothetical protein
VDSPSPSTISDAAGATQPRNASCFEKLFADDQRPELAIFIDGLNEFSYRGDVAEWFGRFAAPNPTPWLGVRFQLMI